MFCLSHILANRADVSDHYNCLGRLYPDVFTVSPQLPYGVTHFSGTLSLHAFLRTAAIRGPEVYSFARGVAQHVDDDKRLSQIARRLQVDAAGLAFIAQQAIGPAIDQALLQNALLVPIAAGLIEIAVARRSAVDLSSLAGIEALLTNNKVCGFVADFWQIGHDTVRKIHKRWAAGLSPLPWHDLPEFARQELVHYWPRYASNHLRGAGLLTNREAIRARRNLESAQGQFLEAMLYCSQRIDPKLIN